MAAYLNSQGIKRVALLYGDNPYGEELSSKFPGFLEQRDMQLTLGESSNLTDTDFRTDILKIIQSNPQAIFVHQGEQQIGLFAKQLRQMGSEIPIYAVYVAESPATIAAGGAYTDGIHYTYPLNSSLNSASDTAFTARYAAAYGKDQFPTASTLFVYDGMMLLDRALSQCSATDISCIKNFFAHLGTYSGLSGTMMFNSDGSIVRPFGIKEIKNGQFVWVTQNVKL
jgi:branched-chain amino acid transport system substrate-binding protein